MHVRQLLFGAVLLGLLANGRALGETPAPGSPAIQGLAHALERGDSIAERQFWTRARTGGVPLVEPDPANDHDRLLTFVIRAPVSVRRLKLVSNLNALQVRRLVADFGADTTLGRFSLVPHSSTWYATYRVPAALRIPYLIAVEPQDTLGLHLTRAEGADDYLDPANPNVFARGVPGAEASIVALDAAPSQPWRATPFVARFDTLSVGLGAAARCVLVWTPAHPAGAAPREMAVLLAISSATFADRIPTASMLQFLLRTGAMRPTLLAIVPEPDPSDESRRYAGTTAFLADTVLPALRVRYALSTRAEDVVVTGTSRRGLVAAIAAVDRPDAMGAVLALSGSFFWAPAGEGRYEWLASRLARETRKPIRWFIASGSLETVVTPGNRGHYMVATNRHLDDVLVAKGYAPGYLEFAGVHHEANWEDALAAGLRTLLPPR